MLDMVLNTLLDYNYEDKFLGKIHEILYRKIHESQCVKTDADFKKLYHVRSMMCDVTLSHIHHPLERVSHLQ